MTWKCPDCGAENPDSKQECSCGYAYYKVMGIKPGESEKLVGQTYKYLMTVWQESKFANDPIALKNARNRKKKINDAYEIFRKHFATGLEDAEGKRGRLKMISLAALFILVIAGAIIYLTASQKSSPVKQPATQEGNENIPQPSGGNQADVQGRPEGTNASRGESPSQQMPPPDQSGLSDILPDNPEEKAIALVKKSHVIDKIMDADTLMKKWAADNSAKFQVLGWKAKKMDEQIYLVTYSMSDGITTKGFYFDIDLSTGTIRHLADYPELQKKYGIQYKQ